MKSLHSPLTCIYFSFLRISTGTRSGVTLHLSKVFHIVGHNGSRSKIQKREDETPLWASLTPEEKTLAIDRVESRQKICGWVILEKVIFSHLSRDNLPLCFRFFLKKNIPCIFSPWKAWLSCDDISYFTEHRIRMTQKQDHASQFVWSDKSSVITRSLTSKTSWQIKFVRSVTPEWSCPEETTHEIE